ncbi:MAG: Uma2 family endonuclease [Planctomycetaceae bacterium]
MRASSICCRQFLEGHGEPHLDLVTWIGTYKARTQGVGGGDNSTLKLDLDNAPQPDGYLRLLPEHGGQARLVDGYVVGAPELVVEIAASSASYDLGDKLNAYRRNQVREYIVWRTWDRAVDWFVLSEGSYIPMSAGQDGIHRSRVFPGLWLDATAVIEGRIGKVLDTLLQGIHSDEHAAFLHDISKKAKDDA